MGMQARESIVTKLIKVSDQLFIYFLRHGLSYKLDFRVIIALDSTYCKIFMYSREAVTFLQSKLKTKKGKKV